MYQTGTLYGAELNVAKRIHVVKAMLDERRASNDTRARVAHTRALGLGRPRMLQCCIVVFHQHKVQYQTVWGFIL